MKEETIYCLTIILGICVSIIGVYMINEYSDCYVAKGISPSLLENLFCQFLPVIFLIGIAMTGGSVMGLYYFRKNNNEKVVV